MTWIVTLSTGRVVTFFYRDELDRWIRDHGPVASIVERRG